MLPLALTLALAAGPVESPALSVDAPSAPGEVVTLDTAEQVRILCDVLHPPERALGAGAPDGGVGCAPPAGSRAWVLGVEPFSWELRERGRTLARGGEGGDRPVVTTGALPHVDVAEPIGELGGRDLRAAIAARTKDLEGCYRRALSVVPALDGSVVAELDLGGDAGVPRGVRIAIDSLQD